MKTMKKILVTVMLSLTLTLTACGGSDSTPQEPVTQESKQDTETTAADTMDIPQESMDANQQETTADAESIETVDPVMDLLPGMMDPTKAYEVSFRFEDGILYVEGNGPLFHPRYGYVDENQDKNLITEVVICEGITSIGGNAFYR